MLVAIAHRAAAGLREPECRIVRRTHQVIAQMRETKTNPIRADRRNQLNSGLERCEPGTTLGQATMVDVRLTGRGCVLAHAPLKGGQGLTGNGGRRP